MIVLIYREHIHKTMDILVSGLDVISIAIMFFFHIDNANVKLAFTIIGLLVHVFAMAIVVISFCVSWLILGRIYTFQQARERMVNFIKGRPSGVSGDDISLEAKQDQ